MRNGLVRTRVRVRKPKHAPDNRKGDDRTVANSWMPCCLAATTPMPRTNITWFWWLCPALWGHHLRQRRWVCSGTAWARHPKETRDTPEQHKGTPNGVPSEAGLGYEPQHLFTGVTQPRSYLRAISCTQTQSFGPKTSGHIRPPGILPWSPLVVVKLTTVRHWLDAVKPPPALVREALEGGGEGGGSGTQKILSSKWPDHMSPMVK